MAKNLDEAFKWYRRAMSAEQIAQAEKMAKDWKPKPEE
jgi:TPR repeat protein